MKLPFIRHFLAALLLCCVAGFLPPIAWSQTFSTTGSLASARDYHTATRLPSGKVLVAGGQGPGGVILAAAEIYDLATGNWSATGFLVGKRYNHTATLLSNGTVLVAGGYAGASPPLVAELYDPATGTWSTTGALSIARTFHTATLLLNGTVLVAGGSDNSNNVLSSAELYDPTTGIWTATGSLATARRSHTATLLPNGQVLVTGGGTGPAELFNPSTGTWSATGSLAAARYSHTDTLLPNGKILVAGGTNGTSYLSTAELYDPVTGDWNAIGSLITARAGHRTTLLPNGKVLAVTGSGLTGSLGSAELYDPALGTWSSTGSLTQARTLHTATLLPNGKVLVAGGMLSSGILSSAELYNPAMLPSVTTLDGTSVSSTTATLSGTVNPNGDATTAQFQYGLNTAYGSTASVSLSPNNGSSVQAVSAAITGLTPGTAYHYRLAATNSGGTSNGGDLTFTTLTPVQNWRQTWFSTTANTGNAADTADPYQTGVPNLAVFALLGPNQDPAKVALGLLPQPQRIGANYVLTFFQPSGVSGVTYGAEWCVALAVGNWTPMTDTGSGATHTFSIPIGTGDPIFFRLRVSSP